MSIRKKRIAEDYNLLKRMYKQKLITQVKGFPGSKKSIEHLAILLEGPKGSPYEHGIYKLELRYGSDYPYSPPFVRLHTPIWHPNFWPNPKEYPGKRNICLGLVDPELRGTKQGWSPSKNVNSVVNSILAKFNIDKNFTNPHDVFNKKAAKEILKDVKKFKKKAREINNKYARVKW